MSETDSHVEGRTLSLFATFRHTAAYWDLDPDGRARRMDAWLGDLRRTASVHRYRIYPTRAEADLLLWCGTEAEGPEAPGDFFRAFGEATEAVRRFVEPVTTLWGLTRPSPYARRGSRRAIDPLRDERLPYLVVYPFVKTPEWYLLDGEERQGMMNGHIRVGRQYPDVQQLLLYSFGLQDQEFVVVYEMEDLSRFSALVSDLRRTEARPYTARDTPLWTAVLDQATRSDASGG